MQSIRLPVSPPSERPESYSDAAEASGLQARRGAKRRRNIRGAVVPVLGIISTMHAYSAVDAWVDGNATTALALATLSVTTSVAACALWVYSNGLPQRPRVASWSLNLCAAGKWTGVVGASLGAGVVHITHGTYMVEAIYTGLTIGYVAMGLLLKAATHYNNRKEPRVRAPACPV